MYVFPLSPAFSAFGAALADVIHTHVTTYRSMMPADPENLNKILLDIEEKLFFTLQREGFTERTVEFRRTFYLRYRRQLNELAVRVPTKKYAAEDLIDIMREFDRRYEETYGAGTAYSEAGIELISLSVDAVGHTGKPALESYKEEGADASGALKGSRKVYFTFGVNEWVTTRIYDMSKLRPGNVVSGPAVIETPTTTLLIPPRNSAKIDVHGFVEMDLR